MTATIVITVIAVPRMIAIEIKHLEQIADRRAVRARHFLERRRAAIRNRQRSNCGFIPQEKILL